MSEYGPDYSGMENLLTRIHGQYIKLPDGDVRRNNIVLDSVINQIITKMKQASALFANMYREKYYGGSYYDGLKIGQPNEYDLDCLLYLPKDAGAVIVPSDQNAYVYVQLTKMDIFRAKKENLERFKGLERLIDADNYLLTDKVLNWMKSVLDLALNSFDVQGSRYIIRFFHLGEYQQVLIKVRTNGPALMLEITGQIEEKPLYIDVDLVTCFKFFGDQWPDESIYTPNPSHVFDTFFVVPKSYNDTPCYWRLSFQEQERELMGNDYKNLKSTLRLLKKIRDNFDHKIASYYIKTIFLIELKKADRKFWNQPLSNTFMFMLKKYHAYIRNGEIPYYWNVHHNLIGNLSLTTRQNIANFLQRMINDIDRNFKTDSYVAAKYLIPGIRVRTDTVPLTFWHEEAESILDNRLVPVEGVVQQESSSWCNIL